jgi:hypothetical protein
MPIAPNKESELAAITTVGVWVILGFSDAPMASYVVAVFFGLFIGWLVKKNP